jgi:hypothetical protein
MTIGPHEGRELELMTSGIKPLSMFEEPDSSDVRWFPEHDFDVLVAEGKLVKRVVIAAIPRPDNSLHNIRRVFYALPQEQWRIPAFILVQELYDSLLPGWRTDLDRVMGLLLGYSQEDIEQFVGARSSGA